MGLTLWLLLCIVCHAWCLDDGLDSELAKLHNLPKFGTRLSPLLRTFNNGSSSSSTTTTTAAPPITQDYNLKTLGEDEEDLTFNDNTINRNDYMSTDEYFGMMGDTKTRHFFGASLNQSLRTPFNKSLPAKPASHAQAPRLEMSTEFFLVPPTQLSSVLSTKAANVRPNGVVLATKHLAGHNHTLVVSSNGSLATNATVTAHHVPKLLSNSNGLRKEPWVVPVLVLACLSMIMMAAFEIFVLCKTRRTSPNRRHLFLGQMLLLGLFSFRSGVCVATGQMYIFD